VAGDQGDYPQHSGETKAGANLSRADSVYLSLKQKIRSGEFTPGDRLREIDLAARLDVSRTPIREAIGRLASEGLVELAPSRGVMVTRLDRQQVRELYALRESLEAAAAVMAAQNASANEIAEMEDILARSKGDALSADQHARLNQSFHKLIHEAAHNRYLTRALEQLSDSLALLPGTTFEVAGRPAVALQEHRDLLKAISERDTRKADEAARLHIRNAALTRLRLMFDQ
jgi:DNA-binding GntR family transcriptional regulator